MVTTVGATEKLPRRFKDLLPLLLLSIPLSNSKIYFFPMHLNEVGQIDLCVVYRKEIK